MRIIFFGNTKYSVIVAQSLLKEYGLSSVVTIPDRPIGRKKTLTASPVKQFALGNNIPVFTTSKLDQRILGVKPLKSSDFLVVADYGLILPKKLLEIPKYAALNVHHSLLPKYRGPSPAPTAILNGEKISGVTIIKMAGEVDAGDILAQKEYTLKPDETADSLLTTLNTFGGELVVDVIAHYQQIKPIPQDEKRATMTKRMTKQDGYIDLTNPPSPEKLDRMIRAYYPWPSVWTTVQLATPNKKQLTINQLEVSSQKLAVIKFLPQQKIQVEGGKPMNVKDFLNGYPQMRGKIENLL